MPECLGRDFMVCHACHPRQNTYCQYLERKSHETERHQASQSLQE